MIFSQKKKVLSAVLSLAMIGTIFASVPFSASADTTATAAKDIGVSYSTQIQTIGWQAAVVDGALSGTVGKAKRLEAIKINLTGADLPTGAKITYQTQVQTIGWQTAVSDGALAGTVGKAKRLEAIKITLSGMPGYSVKYQVQGQTYGWQDAVSTENGTAIADASLAGTVGKAKRLEAIKITIVKDGTTPTSPVDDSNLKVSSVAATSSKTIAVTFNQAPSDTSKIAATVKLNSTASTVTSSWNSDNTVLTLTKASKFSAASYTVDVTNDTTDLGSNTATFTEQKVAKIDITSTKLAYTLSGTTYTGYVNYKVYDQYAADITNTSLGKGITINCAGLSGTIKGDGVATIASETSFINYTSVVVSAYNTSSGAYITKTLTVNSTLGTLGSFTLGTALQDEAGAATTLSASSSSVAYIPFTATDVSGNATTDYTLINNGLINFATSGTIVQLTSSASTYVTASIIKDPSDSTKAMIQVATTGTKVTIDTPVIISAMLKSGTGNSQMTFTLKKAATLTTFTMTAPDSTVTTDETAVYIPFTAQDQDGNEITDGQTIYDAYHTNSYLSLNASNGTVDIVKGANGNAYVKFVPTHNLGVATTALINANTSAGKYSSVTFTIDIASTAETLSVSSSNYVKNMAIGSVQDLGIGTGGHDGISVLDSNSETTSLKSATSTYAVIAYSSAPTVVAVSSSHNYAYGNNYIELSAPSSASAGTASITFALVKRADLLTAIKAGTAYSEIDNLDSTSVTFSVTANSDVTSYAIDTISNVYAAPTSYGAVASTYAATSGQRYAYATTAVVYGKTSSGTRVLLPTQISGTGNTVLSSVTASNTDFYAYSDVSYEGANTPKVIVFGNAYSSTSSKTSSTGTLTAVIKALNGSTTTATASLASTSADPVATSLVFSSDVTTANTDCDSTIGNVTLPGSVLGTNPIVHVIQTSTVNEVEYPGFYFYAPDQYGWASSPVTVSVGTETQATGKTALPTLYYNPTTGCLATGSTSGSAFDFSSTAYTGDTLTLTATTVNGLTSTVTITIADTAASTFTVSQNADTANTTAVLGLVGTAVSSSTSTVATAAIVNGYIVITSAAAGTTNITVTGTNTSGTTVTATIPVTVDSTGAITIGTIKPNFTTSTNALTANTKLVLGLVGTTALTSNSKVATADVTTTSGYVTIKSVAAGTATITVANTTASATITVTVDGSGAITIDNITPYTASSVTFKSQTNSDTVNPVITTDTLLTVTGTQALTSDATVATADVTTKSGYVTITSVGAGTATITITDGVNSVYTTVTVDPTGAITLGDITGTIGIPATPIITAQTVKGGATTVEIPKVPANETAYLAVDKTTVFTPAAATLTSAATGATTITAPTTAGTYYLYLVSTAGTSTHSVNAVTVDTIAPAATVASTSTASALILTPSETATIAITTGGTATGVAGTNEITFATAATNDQTVEFTLTDVAGNITSYTGTYTTASGWTLA